MSESAATRGYRDLVVWRKAMDLIPLIYALARQLPAEENFALGSQIRRAVISVAANIAEGQARNHPKEFLQFLAIARGSLAELDTLLQAALRLQYATAAQLAVIEPLLIETRRVLQGLMQIVKRRT